MVLEKIKSKLPITNYKLHKTMSRKCDICGRSAMKGATRSHSNVKTLKRQKINIQSKVVDGERKKVCTSCIKTLKKKAKK